MNISFRTESWPLEAPFRISGAEWSAIGSIVVRVEHGGHVGRGEAQGVDYLGETLSSMCDQVAAISDFLARDPSRSALQELLPPGGARNAIDCALWDLECKQSGQSIWELTGIEPRSLATAYTIGLEGTPEAMARKAAACAAPLLKVKLDRDRPYQKLAAVRTARPDARLVVDANQGWDFPLLRQLIPRLAELGVEMVEQPLPRGEDAVLEGLDCPIALAADESCQHRGELAPAARRYQVINIKLDKAGGLTEALRLAAAARERGCSLMAGNMIGTSLAMAPAFVVAQLCDFVDLDGPVLLRRDRAHGLAYDRGTVHAPDPRLWG
ncbi:MAG: dipeptide epimerase [Xanthomonadales bacterium]|nr:dipeptide epimerase [Xanthomonadales bacterium]